MGSVGEEVRPQALFLDTLAKHLLQRGRLGHQAPDFNALNEISAFLPLALLERLARLHDMVPRALGGTGENLPVSKVQQPPEWLGDRLALLFFRVDAGKEGDLDEHARDEECSLEELGVD